jgi:hypothetical protein
MVNKKKAPVISTSQHKEIAQIERQQLSGMCYLLSKENGTVDDKHVAMIESGRDDGTISFTG